MWKLIENPTHRIDQKRRFFFSDHRLWPRWWPEFQFLRRMKMERFQRLNPIRPASIRFSPPQSTEAYAPTYPMRRRLILDFFPPRPSDFKTMPLTKSNQLQTLKHLRILVVCMFRKNANNNIKYYRKTRTICIVNKLTESGRHSWIQHKRMHMICILSLALWFPASCVLMAVERGFHMSQKKIRNNYVWDVED